YPRRKFIPLEILTEFCKVPLRVPLPQAEQRLFLNSLHIWRDQCCGESARIKLIQLINKEQKHIHNQNFMNLFRSGFLSAKGLVLFASLIVMVNQQSFSDIIRLPGVLRSLSVITNDVSLTGNSRRLLADVGGVDIEAIPGTTV